MINNENKPRTVAEIGIPYLLHIGEIFTVEPRGLF
jgi:hypothetical protein